MAYLINRLNALETHVDSPDPDVPVADPIALRRTFLDLSRFMAPGTPTPSVLADAEGAVLLVWHKDGWDIEVEVGREETEVWAQERGSQRFAGPLAQHESDLREALARLSVEENP